MQCSDGVTVFLLKSHGVKMLVVNIFKLSRCISILPAVYSRSLALHLLYKKKYEIRKQVSPEFYINNCSIYDGIVTMMSYYAFSNVTVKKSVVIFEQ